MSQSPAWIEGSGRRPDFCWTFTTQGKLLAMAVAPESNELLVSDESQRMFRVNAQGEQLARLRLSASPKFIECSADGSSGVIALDNQQILRFDAELQATGKLQLKDQCLALAVAPYGQFFAVSTDKLQVRIYDSNFQRVSQIETTQPLTQLKFATKSPLLYGASANGLLCCYDLNGLRLWEQTTTSSCGQLAITGAGDFLYAASHREGVQAYQGQGEFLGSYLLEGTSHSLGVSFTPSRLIVATVEQDLYWLFDNGSIGWRTTVGEEIVRVACDLTGQQVTIGLRNSGVFRLCWRS